MSNPTADIITERRPTPKSILKKRPPSPPSTPFTEPEPITGLTPSQATRILQLARTELIKPSIPLSTFELLSSLPQESSSAPSSFDVSTFLSQIKDFSPSEYLDLIEERNCLNKCGYTLCPNPKRNIPGEFKIHKRGVAKTADLNKWCSDRCAVKALYIKVQLDNPTYVWKQGQMVVKVELKEEEETQTTTPAKSAGEEEKLSKDMTKLDLNKNNKTDEEKKVRQMVGALAIERNRMSGTKVEVNIKEKETTQVAQAPTAVKPEDAHLIVEGYNSASKGKKPARDEDDSDDDDDDDPFPTVRLEVINMGKSQS
ncbi:Rtr1/RPAP2 family-domain-containing protein [Podospora fimiseda]|uniref:RNA polymerase II subunit B1 CTD phosphatase RPAP2 homolog n=1 Tax=Podospora fimiseda TaxID=252190 RepID=A0AAN7BSP8_9PEZI|nr:Rtr1/RPAP2 family-domain-containing protein [Podospora fimiseda]